MALGPHQQKNTHGSARTNQHWEAMAHFGFFEFSRAEPRKFVRRLRRGAPQKYRWASWKARCLPMGGHIDGHLSQESIDNYYRLTNAVNEYTQMITIDVPRTYPDLEVFDACAREKLKRLLVAYANHAPCVGYCQGMNFVAGTLLLVSNFAEFEAFYVFVVVMDVYGLRGFYSQNFPLLRVYVEAYEDQLATHLPRVAAQFGQLEIGPPLYLHQWFLTLFVVGLPLRTATTLWDYILAESLSVVIPISVGLLSIIERYLLCLNFEDSVQFIKSLKWSGNPHEDHHLGQLLRKRSRRLHIALPVPLENPPPYPPPSAVANSLNR